MYEMNVPNGIKAFGYSTDDIPLLVKGTLPQVSSILRDVLSNREYYFT